MMRDLTLNEKISIKGELAKHGLFLPLLTMRDALHFWRMCFGRSIAQYSKRLNQRANRLNDIKENIQRLEHTIKLDCWNAGYIENCKAAIETYKKMLNEG